MHSILAYTCEHAQLPLQPLRISVPLPIVAFYLRIVKLGRVSHLIPCQHVILGTDPLPLDLLIPL